MDPKKLLGQDERLVGICAYCGGGQETVDHVPPKVFLDEPYPAHLRTVAACLPCNNSMSLDELYAACFLECVVCGTTDPDQLTRPKIARRLRDEQALAQLLARARNDVEPSLWAPDQKRFENVARKLAQGDAAWELTLPAMGDPDVVSLLPLECMAASQRAAFEVPPTVHHWPELGSRAFYRALSGPGATGWSIVQEGRYRYCVGQDHGLTVRIVVREYLAMLVHWE